MVRWAALLPVLVLLAGTACSGDNPKPAADRTATTTTTTIPPVSTTAAPEPTAPTSSTTVGRTSTTAVPPGPGVAATQLRGVTSGQAVVVTADAYGRTSATLTAYERVGPGWRAVAGPWTARVGSAGVAPPGAKREGDLRTPSGTYGFGFMFGIDEDPGVRFPFRRVTGPNIVWDDDPESPRYNEWTDTNEQAAGANPEPMYVRPVYDLGAVIAYNTERTPGRGSAIFLHVSAGRATAGCVALPADQLRSVLRWLDPARSPVIVIGVA